MIHDQSVEHSTIVDAAVELRAKNPDDPRHAHGKHHDHRSLGTKSWTQGAQPTRTMVRPWNSPTNNKITNVFFMNNLF